MITRSWEEEVNNFQTERYSVTCTEAWAVVEIANINTGSVRKYSLDRASLLWSNMATGDWVSGGVTLRTLNTAFRKYKSILLNEAIEEQLRAAQESDKT